MQFRTKQQAGAQHSVRFAGAHALLIYTFRKEVTHADHRYVALLDCQPVLQMARD